MKAVIAVTMLFMSFALLAPVSAQAEPDPTRPAIGYSESGEASGRNGDRLPALVLNSIMYRSGESRATINGTDYSVGDTVSGWQIRAIEYDRVLIESDEQIVVLSVFSAPRRLSAEEL